MAARKSVVSVLCLSAVLTLAASSAAARSSRSDGASPWENAQVLVEVFRVEVQVDALYESGVNILGQNPEGISTLNLLWCLRDEEKGRVTSGMKAGVGHNQESESQQEKTIYLSQTRVNPNSGAVEITGWNSYEQGQRLNVKCYVNSENSISLRCKYQETSFEKPKNPDEDPKGVSRPPNLSSFVWEGGVCLQNGIPEIVAGEQDDETADFLVITATLQHRSEEQTAETAAEDASSKNR